MEVSGQLHDPAAMAQMKINIKIHLQYKRFENVRCKLA
jgi:hypothetical protein